MSGQLSHAAGLAAEDAVARHYRDAGATPLAQRWRGGGGEIDLVYARGDAIIFVEVKKSRSHASAAAALGAGQQARLRGAAETYLGGLPAGLDTECRFDVALVDAIGAVEVIENALV